MRILVFGAGVLGGNLASNLFRSKKDVTLLARGVWADEIKSNGLRIKKRFKPGVSVSRIPVITELTPDDIYDVIFVVMRYTQLDSVIDVIRKNRTKNIFLSETMSVCDITRSCSPIKTSCLPLHYPPDTVKATVL